MSRSPVSATRRPRVLGAAVALALLASLVPVASTAAAADHFQVLPDVPSGGWVAGATYEVTVLALNPDGGRDTTYTGRVRVSSTDLQAILPPDYTFTLADHGDRTFLVALRTAGHPGIGVFDLADPSVYGASGPITVVPAAPVALGFQQAPGNGTAGTPLARQPFVAIRDSFGNVVTTTSAVVTLGLVPMSGEGTLSCNGGTSLATVSGVAWFAGCLVDSEGTYQLYASAPGFAAITSLLFTIAPVAGASHFVITAPPTADAGSEISIIAWAARPDGMTDAAYRGTVHVTCTDPAATLPADYTFAAADSGVRSLRLTLRTPGSQTVTITDVAGSSITGAASVSVVAVAGTATLGLVALTPTITYGDAASFEVAFTSGGAGATIGVFRWDPDSTAWSRQQTVVADGAGRGTFSYAPAFTATYSAVCESGCPGATSMTSNMVAVSVRHSVSLTPASAGVRAVAVRSRITYTARVGPVVAAARPRVMFSFYEKLSGRWVLRSQRTFTTNAAGIVRYRVTWSTRGEWYVRARALADTYNLLKDSPIVRVRVT